MDRVAEVTIKGRAYEDVMNILGINGYATEVFTPVIRDANIDEVDHIIRIYDCRSTKTVKGSLYD